MYEIVVVFYNLKGYDSHHIIRSLKKRFLEKRHLKTDEIYYNDIDVISLTDEKYLTFKIGNIKFIDPAAFLPESLDKLVQIVYHDGKHKFKHTIMHGKRPHVQ